MTTFKCPSCGGHWQEGPTRDMREDTTCRKCLATQLSIVSKAFVMLDMANPNPDTEQAFGVFKAIKDLRSERDELVDTLRDTAMVATGPCQVPLIDRCRCWRCVNQRVDALLAKHPISQEPPCQP